MNSISTAIVAGVIMIAGSVVSAVPKNGALASDPCGGEIRSVVEPDTLTKKAPLRVATSPTYGYSATEAIPIGGAFHNGVARSREYLRSLRGPKGQTISYHRRGSCCPFTTENSELGSGVLDVYELTYDGLEKPLVIYINIYDPGLVMIPQGLTVRE